MKNDICRSTRFGDVRGIAAGQALVWYGVPYAAAPVGCLRWSAPVDPEPWSGTRDCTVPGSVAIQYAANKGTIAGSEDCLNLDVYAPAGAKDLPVLVYIHGGNNQTGSSLELPGIKLVYTNQCVFVSLNHRLGLLGFNCLPALQAQEGDTGNYALLDIAKALDWVKANIATFGGDPDNITVSGFSAGGRDIMAMLVSPLFAGKFHKAAAFSGGMTVANRRASTVQIAAALAPLAVEDGKAADITAARAWLLTDGEDVRDYLYSLSAQRLAPLMCDAQIRMSVFPHLYADGVTLPAGGFAGADYNAVPLMLFTGSGEFGLFCAALKATNSAAAAFAEKYGSDMYRIFNAQVSAETMYGNYGAPIYIAQVDYNKTAAGAYHGIIVPMLTSERNSSALGDFSAPGFLGMAEKFNAYLSHFLASGDPNGRGLERWDAWTPEAKLSMIFDADENGGVTQMKDVSGSYDQIIAAMEADQSVPEEVKKQVVGTVTNGRWFSAAQDEHFKVPSPWVMDKKIASGTQTVVIEGFDWGPGVTKTILTLDTPIAAGSVTAAGFAVLETKQSADWVALTVGVSRKPRAVTAAYTSDGRGGRVEGASNCVTLELSCDPDNGNPYCADPVDPAALGQNRFANPYHLDVSLSAESTLTAADGTPIGELSVSDVDLKNAIVPQLECVDLTGVFTGSDGKTLTYASYAPEADGKKHPLVVWLHGAGEGGDDPSIPLLGNKVTPLYGEEFQSVMGGAYVLTPQTPLFWLTYTENGDWQGNPGTSSIYKLTLLELIKHYISADPGIDANRVYVGGCSNGGFMTLDLIMTEPELFAAAFPICEAYRASGITDEKLSQAAKVPAWFVYAENDTVVPPAEFAAPMIARLRAAGADVHTSVFPDVHDTSGLYANPDGTPYQYPGHWSWTYFFNNRCEENGVRLWQWLADQHK